MQVHLNYIPFQCPTNQFVDYYSGFTSIDYHYIIIVVFDPYDYLHNCWVHAKWITDGD